MFPAYFTAVYPNGYDAANSPNISQKGQVLYGGVKGCSYRRIFVPDFLDLRNLYQDTEAFCHNLWILIARKNSRTVSIH